MSTLVIVAVVAAFFVLIALLPSPASRASKLLRSGVPARGVILYISQLSLRDRVVIAGQPYESRVIRLDVEVSGLPPYEVQAQMMLPSAMIRTALPGVAVDLRVDPVNAKLLCVAGPGGVYFAG